MYCDNTLYLCVGGLISSIIALAWSLQQEIKLRAIIESLQDGETQ